MGKIKVIALIVLFFWDMCLLPMELNKHLEANGCDETVKWSSYYSLAKAVGPYIDKKYQNREQKINIDKCAAQVCKKIDTNTVFDGFADYVSIGELSDADIVHLAKVIDKQIPLIPQEDKLIEVIRLKKDLGKSLVNVVFDSLVSRRVAEIKRVDGCSINSVLTQKNSCLKALPPLFARRIKHEVEQQIMRDSGVQYCSYILDKKARQLTIIKFSPDDLKLACADNRVVNIYYIKTGDIGASLVHDSGVSALCWHPNNKDFATCAGLRIYLWNTKNQECTRVIDVGTSMRYLDYIPTTTIIQSENGMWDFQTGEFIKSNPFYFGSTSVLTSSNATSDKEYFAKIIDWGQRVSIEKKITFFPCLIDIACKNSNNHQALVTLLQFVEGYITIEQEKLKEVKLLAQEKQNCSNEYYCKVLEGKIKQKINKIKDILILKNLREDIADKIVNSLGSSSPSLVQKFLSYFDVF